MKFIDGILSDRYLTFSKYRDASPFFDEDLNAHILLKFDDISDFFKKRAISSNRKKQQFELLDKCPFSHKIVDFYSEWLMYMDGDKHKEYRKLISKALSIAMKNIDEYVIHSINKELKIILSGAKDNVDIISSVSHPFLITILSALFGVNKDNYEKLINISKPIVSFISSGSLGTDKDRKSVVNSLKETECILEYCIENHNDENSFIGILQRNNVGLDIIKPLLINVLIDGYDPLLSSINYYFYVLSKGHTIPNDLTSSELFDELIRLEPAFQYLARITTEEIDINGYKINKGDRVISFIPSGNRDEKKYTNANDICIRAKKDKHLSFGLGVHKCVGAVLSKKILVLLIDYISKECKNLKFELVDEKWDEFIGFRALSRLTLNIKKVGKNE